MPGEIFVDVSYRGLEIGRRHKLCEVGPTTAYVEHPTPMPVGTRLALFADGVEVEVEVVRVHEQVAGAERSPGMRVAAPALSPAAAALWQSLVSVDDPVTPTIPLVAPPMSRSPRSEEAAPPEVDHRAAVIAAKGRSTTQIAAVGERAKRTTSEVAAAKIREARTEVMPAVDIEAIVATAAGATSADADSSGPVATDPAGGKKKRGGRKRTPKK
jgi:hypothetical protein